jgi:hypothetical protein
VTAKVVAASAAVAAVVLVVAATTSLSLGRAALLAPVLVVGIACVLGLAVFWGRVGAQHLREARHPRVIVAVFVGAVALLVGLTLLGVDLPRE